MEVTVNARPKVEIALKNSISLSGIEAFVANIRIQDIRFSKNITRDTFPRIVVK